MITFDYITLNAFFEENKEFFRGARLQKIQQPTRRDFLFTLRAQGETKKFYINIDPQVYHICFITDETSFLRNISIPKKPPMFCMLLRKYLEGFRIIDVKVPKYERIFEIYFESYNELNESVKLCLAIELMGKYSNVILYNTDTNIIIGCAHNVGEDKSRERELMGTLPYVYPQSQRKTDILKYNGAIDYKTLNGYFYGISKAFQNQLEKKVIPLEKIKNYVALKAEIMPAANEKEFSIYSDLITNPIIYPTVNEMIDSYFSAQQENIIKRALKLKLKNSVNTNFQKQKNLYEKICSQLSKKDKSAKYKKYADLIIANLYNNKDYSKQITVQDWEGYECSGIDNKSNQIIISLDEKLTLKENAQKYYQLYTKSKNSVERLNNLKNEAKEKMDYYNTVLFSINCADKLSELYEILSETEEGKNDSQKTLNQKKSEIAIYSLDINGFKVYVGKNNRQNDYIISKLSSPNDIWFHAQNCPSSHVLLKITDNREPDEKTIYECAKLTKKYSSASKDKKIGIIYTKRKYIKKPPKSNPGYVIYKNEKEIMTDN